MSSDWGLWNGAWRRVGEAVVPATSEAVHFGLGVFTTLGVREGQPLDVEWHQRRLIRDAAALGLPRPALEGLAERCGQVAERNGLGWGGLKVQLLQVGSVVVEWIQPRTNPYAREGYGPGRRLLSTVCAPRRERPLSRVKSLNYAEHHLARLAATAAGFDDALWIDSDGAILETSTANIFYVRDGACFTPPVSEGLLPGVVRERLLQSDLGVRECPFPRACLDEVTEVFLTNSLAGVLPVAAIDDRPLPTPASGWGARAQAYMTKLSPR